MAKRTKHPEPVVCPDCGDNLDASVKFDCDVDPATGRIVRADSGGEVSLTCSNDCGWSADHGTIGPDDDWPEPVKMDDLEPSDDDTLVARDAADADKEGK